MKVKCPFLHYPRYAMKVYLKDGRVVNQRGTSQPELNINVDEEDVVAIVVECRAMGGGSCGTRMLIDGVWAPYSEASLDELLNPPIPEPEPEPDPGPGEVWQPGEVEAEVEEAAGFDDEVYCEVDEEDEDE
jgi:hypothetical protein